MPEISRRMFIATAAAAGSLRALPALKSPPVRRVLTLVYDKSLGAMRAVDRVIN